MNSKPTEELNAKFIKDAPSDEDFFGSHSKVSDAVADVIVEPNSIQSIGLLGSWGSGKSTVVKQIEKRLAEGQDSIHCFNYDAWLNQNDPPRRSFLEALIRDLVRNSLIPETGWESRLSGLAGKSEETTTTTTRKLSLTGKWLVGSLALVPIGTVVLGAGLSHENMKNEAWMIAIGALLTLAPALVGLIFYFLWRPWQLSLLLGATQKEFWTTHREPYAAESILALLTNQSTERTDTTTKISPDPTASEFRAVFRDVLLALGEKRAQLVIVIDNLDRLPESDAIKLWATMRSLYVGPESCAAAGAARALPTVLVPIDEGSVERMFESEGAEDPAALAKSFMDKTFDVSFYVNDPVMSDWRAFFRTKLHEAFGEFATEERIYWATKFVEERMAAEPGVRTATPRTLVKTVNSIAALAKQWGTEALDFLSLALFAVHREEIAQSPIKFVSAERANAATAIEDWKRETVALHYGVPKAKAFQALLLEPLKIAVASGDENEFAELAKVTGFDPIYEEVIKNPPAAPSSDGPDPNFVLNAALLAAQHTSSNWAARGLRDAASIWPSCGKMSTFRNDFAQAIGAMAPHNTQAEFLNSSASQLSASLSEASLDRETLNSIVDALKLIKETATRRGVKHPTVMAPLPPHELFTLVEDVPRDLLPILATDKSAAEIITALDAALKNPDESIDVIAATRALSQRPTIRFKGGKSPDWNPLVATANSTIASNNATFHGTGPSIDVLGILHDRNENAKTNIQQLFDQGHLANRLNEADAAKDLQLTTDITALMMLKGTDFAAPNGKSWEQMANDHEDFAKSLDNSLSWYLNKDRITFALEAMPSRKSLRPAIGELAKFCVSENDCVGLSTSYVLNHVSSLGSLIGEQVLDSALTNLTRRDNFWTALESIQSGPRYEAALLRLNGLNGVDDDRLLDDLKKRLSELADENWQEGIADEGIAYRFAKLYGHEMGQTGNLGDELKAALKEHRLQLLNAENPVRERWFFLTAFVSAGTRATLYKNLRDTIHAGSNVEDLGGLIKAGGARFLVEGKFADASDKTARHVILPLLASNDGVAVLDDHVELFGAVLKGSDKETKVAAREAMDSLNSSTETDEQEASRGVLEAFEKMVPMPKTSEKLEKHAGDPSGDA